MKLISFLIYSHFCTKKIWFDFCVRSLLGWSYAVYIKRGMSTVLSLKDRTPCAAQTTSTTMMAALPLVGLHLCKAQMTRAFNASSVAHMPSLRPISSALVHQAWHTYTTTMANQPNPCAPSVAHIRHHCSRKALLHSKGARPPQSHNHSLCKGSATHVAKPPILNAREHSLRAKRVWHMQPCPLVPTATTLAQPPL